MIIFIYELWYVHFVILYKTGLDVRGNTIRFDQYLEYQAYPSSKCCFSHPIVIDPVTTKSDISVSNN